MFPPDPPVETGKCQNGARRPRVRYAAPRRALACCAPFRRRRFTATGGSGGKTIQREFRVHGHYPESERACLPLVGPEEGANIGEGRLYLTNTGLLMEDTEKSTGSKPEGAEGAEKRGGRPTQEEMGNRNHHKMDAGCSMLDAGYLMPDTRWILDARYWTLDT